ncbi:MAG: PDZ domain-containing protein [Verrucomicrobiota bacterium]
MESDAFACLAWLPRKKKPDSLRPAFVEWAIASQELGRISTPAVCVARPNWFISVIPDGASKLRDRVLTILLKDGQAEGKVIFVDPIHRICVIEADERVNESPLPLASGPAPRAGVALKCYYSQEKTRSTVAGKDRHYRGEDLFRPLLRVRIEEAEEFCHPGAPLVNEKGEIVGLLTGRDLAIDAEAHAIPASQLRKLLLDLEQFNRSEPVWVGLVFHNESSTPVVLDVKPDSPSSEAEIQPGDIILSLGRTRIRDLHDLVDAIHDLPAGVETKVKVLRGMEEISTKLTPRFANTASNP